MVTERTVDTMPDLTPEMVTAENATEIAVRMAVTHGMGWHPEDSLRGFYWIDHAKHHTEWERVYSDADADRLDAVTDACYVHIDVCEAILDVTTPDWRAKYDDEGEPTP